MKEQFQRTEMLMGEAAIEKLLASHVAVFGLGGVGGYVVEALARAGVGTLTLVDHDVVSVSNLNRQILATCETIGRRKTEAAKERIHAIHPECSVYCQDTFFLPETADSFDFSAYDFVVDAIDTVSGKLAIIEQAGEAKTPVISCMGTGNKMDPMAFRVADLYQTSVCPLAKVMRRECRKRGISHLKVVFSTEEPIRPQAETTPENQASGKRPPGSNSFVPAAAGLLLASEVIKALTSR